MVHVIAMEVLPEERDRKYYADNYSCCPPPLFMIFVTLVEVSLAFINLLVVEPTVLSPSCCAFRPELRLQETLPLSSVPARRQCWRRVGHFNAPRVLLWWGVVHFKLPAWSPYGEANRKFTFNFPFVPFRQSAEYEKEVVEVTHWMVSDRTLRDQVMRRRWILPVRWREDDDSFG